jgi:hypothetical protein
MSDTEAKALCDLFLQLCYRAADLPDGGEELRRLARELVQRSRTLWEARPARPPWPGSIPRVGQEW